MQQNSTLSEKPSGLTPIQEQAAIMLASGTTISEVSTKLNVNRSTIYIWLDKVTFQCYYNMQIQDIQNTIRNGIFSLYETAINSLRDCLESTNQPIRLKAAQYIIDKIQQTSIGETSPEKVFRKQCTSDLGDDVWANCTQFDEKKYNQLIKENGLG